MANFSVYDPRQAAMNQLSMLAQKRQQFTDEQYALAEQERLAKVRAMEEQQNEQSRNWLTGTASGAMAGGALLGAPGAVVGGGLGFLGGMASSVQNRQKQNKGESKWKSVGKALMHPAGDTFTAEDIPMGQMMALGAMMPKQPGPLTASDTAAQQAQFDAELGRRGAYARGPYRGQNYITPDSPLSAAYRNPAQSYQDMFGETYAGQPVRR